jgi:hypothetical protein
MEFDIEDLTRFVITLLRRDTRSWATQVSFRQLRAGVSALLNQELRHAILGSCGSEVNDKPVYQVQQATSLFQFSRFKM